MTRAGLEELMEAVRSRYVRATHMEKIRILHEFVASTGPPIMIKFTLPVIKKLGFAPSDTILSLEMRMKCGIGKCGRCNIGSKYVCKDGPVFTLEELDVLPNEY